MKEKYAYADNWEQISLFDTVVATLQEKALSLFTNISYAISKPEPWMIRLLNDAEKAITIGKQTMVLTKTRLSQNQVPEGHKFYHFLVDESVYRGTFVGQSNDDPDKCDFDNEKECDNEREY